MPHPRQQRAMREQYTLRRTRRAAGVHQPGRVVGSGAGLARPRREQKLVEGDGATDAAGAVQSHDRAYGCRQLGSGTQRRQQSVVGQQDARPGTLELARPLARMQPLVERQQHAPGARDRVVRERVRVPVRRQDRHRVTGLADGGHPRGERCHVSGHLGEECASPRRRSGHRPPGYAPPLRRAPREATPGYLAVMATPGLTRRRRPLLPSSPRRPAPCCWPCARRWPTTTPRSCATPATTARKPCSPGCWPNPGRPTPCCRRKPRTTGCAWRPTGSGSSIRSTGRASTASRRATTGPCTSPCGNARDGLTTGAVALPAQGRRCPREATLPDPRPGTEPAAAGGQPHPRARIRHRRRGPAGR